MVVDGATTGDYPEDMQIRPFLDMAFGAGTNSAWKQANMVDSFEQLHKMVSYTGGRLGFVGTQSNLMATLCVMSRVTPFAIPLAADAAEAHGGGTPQASERFNEQRVSLTAGVVENRVRVPLPSPKPPKPQRSPGVGAKLVPVTRMGVAARATSSAAGAVDTTGGSSGS